MLRRALQRSRLQRRGPLLALSIAASAATVRAQPSVSAESAPLSAAGDHTLLVAAPAARGDGTLRFRVAGDYAREPLVLIDAAQVSRRVVVDQLWLRAGAALALKHRFLVAADVPLLLRETGEAPPDGSGLSRAQGFALGDPRVSARARMLGEARATELGVNLEVWLPLATSEYAGDGAFRLRPSLSVGHDDDQFLWAASAGFLFRKSETLPGLLPTRVGSAVTAGAGFGLALDSAGLWMLGPELAGVFTIGNGASLFDPRSTDVSLLLHGRHRLFGGPLEVGAALGPSLGQLPGAADYRALVTVTWSPEAPAPLPDGDEDSVPDESDMCPSLPGVPSSDPLMTGCPELPTDSDGDGIPDIYDTCPQTAGIPTGSRKTHGCPPATDTDRDGFIDLEDACRELPGVANADPKKNGCPRQEPKAQLVERQIVISQQVTFETGTAVLRPESEDVLREVAQVMSDHAELELLEVAGHTDDTGTPELNRRLSQDRAQTVVAWLVAHGIDGKRLRARGYGQDKPIADNATEDGKAKNRRVEFHALSGEPGGAKP